MQLDFIFIKHWLICTEAQKALGWYWICRYCFGTEGLCSSGLWTLDHIPFRYWQLSRTKPVEFIPVNPGHLCIWTPWRPHSLNLGLGTVGFFAWDSSHPPLHEEESLCLQSSVLIAILTSCVRDGAQQHHSEGTESRVSCPTLCRVSVRRSDRPSAHVYVSVSASAPFLLLLYRKEYGLKHFRCDLRF